MIYTKEQYREHIARNLKSVRARRRVSQAQAAKDMRIPLSRYKSLEAERACLTHHQMQTYSLIEGVTISNIVEGIQFTAERERLVSDEILKHARVLDESDLTIVLDLMLLMSKRRRKDPG